MTTASAPGKAILIGEHAVVYGRPAIAIPLPQLRATATVEDGRPGEGVRLVAPDLDHRVHLAEAAPDDPLAVTVRNTLAWLGENEAHDLTVTVRSTIPPARGMGSGAAIATALVRALTAHFGCSPLPGDVSDLVYRTETLFHGTPSGIDNTVVAYEQPVVFVRGVGPTPVTVGGAFPFLVADTGVASPTKVAVGDVRRAWQADPPTYEALFDRIGALVGEAQAAIATGDVETMGRLMNAAQEALARLSVSSPELDHLTCAAREAGALGAKLSGGGRGGIALALVQPGTADTVATALRAAGATYVFAATLAPA